jgi:phosphoribosylanthranilate isomerase
MSISFKRFIQIAGIKDMAEANMLVESGVQYLGFPLHLTVHEPDISEDEAAEIIRSLPEPHQGVLITYLDVADVIVDVCKKLGCSIVQLHEEMAVHEIQDLKKALPDITIIKSLIVTEDNLKELSNHVDEFDNHVDAFILDTYDHTTGASGATGKTHDWNISSTIVELASKPVILAGGLNETNVYEAIKFVRCAGVDTHTGVEGMDGRKQKDAVIKFIEEANRAFKEVEIGL